MSATQVDHRRSAKARMQLAYLRGLLDFEASNALRRVMSEPVSPDDLPATDATIIPPRLDSEVARCWRVYREWSAEQEDAA